MFFRIYDFYIICHYMHLGCSGIGVVILIVSNLSWLPIETSKSNLNWKSFVVIACAVSSMIMSALFISVFRARWYNKLNDLRLSRQQNDFSFSTTYQPMSFTNYENGQAVSNFIYDVQPINDTFHDPPPLYQSIFPIFPNTRETDENKKWILYKSECNKNKKKKTWYIFIFYKKKKK